MQNQRNTQSSRGMARVVVVAIIALLIVLSTAQIFLAARVATTGEEIRRLEQQQAQLALKTQRLEARINEVSSLSSIESKAREELGMVDAVGKVAYLDKPTLESYASR